MRRLMPILLLVIQGLGCDLAGKVVRGRYQAARQSLGTPHKDGTAPTQHLRNHLPAGAVHSEELAERILNLLAEPTLIDTTTSDVRLRWTWVRTGAPDVVIRAERRGDRGFLEVRMLSRTDSGARVVHDRQLALEPEHWRRFDELISQGALTPQPLTGPEPTETWILELAGAPGYRVASVAAPGAAPTRAIEELCVALASAAGLDPSGVRAQ